MVSFKNLSRNLRRHPLAMVVDACIIINAYTLASLVLFARWAPLAYYEELMVFLPIAVVVLCTINTKLGLYSAVGRYVGLNQAIKLIRASFFSIAILITAGILAMPSSRLHVIVMIPIGALIAFILMTGVRFYPRVFYERSLKEIQKPRMNLLIVGAGNAGEMMLRSIQKEAHLAMEVVAFIDDNPELGGLEIHGVPIFSPTERIPEIVEKKDIDEILIAIPSASLEQFQRIWRMCSKTQVVTKTLRPLQSMHLGKVGLNNIREIEIEDVLGRQPVLTDHSQIRDFICNKVVLVSGAGGSIGSELVVQICHHKPARIILVDRDESALYQIHEKLLHNLFHNHEVCVADIRSGEMMDLLFSKYQPQLVFHAAAYKHVPLMELHPNEAVLNNVMGTYIMASRAGEFGAECFVNISTDKAVEPVNIMGATKHLGERLVKDLGAAYMETKYCSVRFGNVLGSRGSVIPIFREQILNGGPITVTHPEMTRYFMLISEAVDLVLQAAAFPDGNVIYVLEMGQPVRIVDLARQMISFMRPDENVEIVFTGFRPGEKIHEQLIDKFETRDVSEHPMIYKVGFPSWAQDSILDKLPELFEMAESFKSDSIKELLVRWIDSYTPFDMERVGTVINDTVSPALSGSGTVMPASNENGRMNYQWAPAKTDLNWQKAD